MRSRLDNHTQVSLQDLRGDIAYIAYAHVHNVLLVVPNMNILGPHVTMVHINSKKDLLLLGLFLHLLNSKTFGATSI